MYGMYGRPQIFEKSKLIGFVMLIVGVVLLAKTAGWIDPYAFFDNELIPWLGAGTLIILSLFLISGEQHHRY